MKHRQKSRPLRRALCTCLLLGAMAGFVSGLPPAGASRALAADIAAPQLKWQNAGCYNSWCERGWYSSPAVADLDGDGQPEVIASAYSVVVLDGATGLPPFGGGGLGRAARLYRALVNSGLAVSVNVSVAATIDPYLFTISATVRQDADRAQVERVILGELARLKTESVSGEELNRAIKGTRAMFAYGSESVTNQAMWMGVASMVADPAWLAHFLIGIAQVTPVDIQRVARTYLTPARRVTGWYKSE